MHSTSTRMKKACVVRLSSMLSQCSRELAAFSCLPRGTLIASADRGNITGMSAATGSEFICKGGVERWKDGRIVC